MSNTSSMTSVQDVLKCIHEHGVQGNTARMEVVNMLDQKQVNTNYWYSPESIVTQLNDIITDYLTGLCGEVSEPKKAMMSKLKFELNTAEDRVVIYIAADAIGHIFWNNDTYTLCWEAYNSTNPGQQFESWNFSGHFELDTLMKKITDVVEAISGDYTVMPVGENMETHDMKANKLQTEERKIQWLENEIKDLEYVLSSDCINRNNKLCRLQMYRELLDIKLGTCRANTPFTENQYYEASRAYIKYLEETLDNTQSLVIAYREKIFEQKDSLLKMCARLGKMGNLAYHNIQAKLTEVFGDKEGAHQAAIKKEQWKNVERKCKETVERNNRPIELTVGDKHVSPKDLGWY